MSPHSAIPTDFDRNRVSLEGKSILISDATTDIGHTLGLGLAKQGATLLLLARKGKHLNALYDSILKSGGAEPMIVEMDINRAQEEQFAQLLNGLEKSFDSLHGVVLLSLTGVPLAPVSLATTNTWQQCLDLTFMRPMVMIRTLLPLLQKAERASVIFNTLRAGRSATAYWGVVGAACAALENLSQTLAEEISDIRFNTLDIGKVNTDLRHKFYPAEAKSALRDIDDKTVLDYFVYLLSDESAGSSGNRYSVPDL